MSSLTDLTIKEAREGLEKGDFSAVELTDAYLKEIEEKDKDIHAYLEVFGDVRNYAKKIKGDEGNLAGIPLAMKDNILIDGKIASAGSKMLENYTATYDATVTKKLRDAGALFLGRTNMDDSAMGSSTESSAFGPTKNPHDLTRVPGGSSGGSTAAVAGAMALGAFGSDTGGSIRQPAAFCGVVGLKPTYGAVSRHGLIALGSSLDCIGPIAKTVEDAEILFNAIKGRDPLDSTTLEEKSSSRAPKVIGVPRRFLEGLRDDVSKNFEESLLKLKSIGYELRDIELPHAKYGVPAYYIILPAEASTNLSRYDGVKYGLHVDGKDLLDDYMKTRRKGFGPEPRRRILIGTYVLSHGYYDAYYNKATAVRGLITKDFTKVFEGGVDAIALPTTPSPAFKIGEKIDDPVQLYLEDIFTVLANHAGVPAISIPAGLVENLPVGLQLIAPHQEEGRLFEIGKKFELA